MKRPEKWALGIFLAFALAAAAAPRTAPITVQGTIRERDTRTGRVVVITGVGMALRLVRVQVTPATQTAGGAAGATLRQLAPGDVVRALCHRTSQGIVADRIDRVVAR